MSTSPDPKFAVFKSQEALLDFAEKRIIGPHVDGLLRDTVYCLLPTLLAKQFIELEDLLLHLSPRVPIAALFDKKAPHISRTHTRGEIVQAAIFPAATKCLTSLEFLAGLWTGNSESANESAVCSYAAEFIDVEQAKIKLLWRMFRHKLAHQGEPTPMFVLAEGERLVLMTDNGEVEVTHDDKITWVLSPMKNGQNLVLRPDDKGPRYIEHFLQPAQAKYKFHVCVSELMDLVVKSAYGNNGYFDRLRADREVMVRFDSAVAKMFFPSAQPRRHKKRD